MLPSSVVYLDDLHINAKLTDVLCEGRKLSELCIVPITALSTTPTHSTVMPRLQGFEYSFMSAGSK